MLKAFSILSEDLNYKVRLSIRDADLGQMLSRIGSRVGSRAHKLLNVEGVRLMSSANQASAEGVQAKLIEKLEATIAVRKASGSQEQVRVFSQVVPVVIPSPSHGVQDVADTSGGCGASFSVAVVSPQFEGKSLLARHRMINVALTKEMELIHALSIRQCLSPAEYAAKFD